MKQPPAINPDNWTDEKVVAEWFTTTKDAVSKRLICCLVGSWFRRRGMFIFPELTFSNKNLLTIIYDRKTVVPQWKCPATMIWWTSILDQSRSLLGGGLKSRNSGMCAFKWLNSLCTRFKLTYVVEKETKPKSGFIKLPEKVPHVVTFDVPVHDVRDITITPENNEGMSMQIVPTEENGLKSLTSYKDSWEIKKSDVWGGGNKYEASRVFLVLRKEDALRLEQQFRLTSHGRKALENKDELYPGGRSDSEDSDVERAGHSVVDEMDEEQDADIGGNLELRAKMERLSNELLRVAGFVGEFGVEENEDFSGLLRQMKDVAKAFK